MTSRCPDLTRRVGVGLVTLALAASAACSDGNDTSGADVATASTASTNTPTTTAGSVPTVPATSASSAAPETAPPATAPAPDIDLAATMHEFVGDGPGGAIALVRSNGATTIEAVGAADADGTALRSDQQMRVGSVSKPFVAVMVLQLVDEGIVALDETLGTYMPDALVGTEVTVAELLSHRSGLPNYTDQPAMLATAFSDLTRTFTPDEMIEFVVEVEPAVPGRFAYSNTNYLLLGQLIEAVDGGDLDASLERRVTGPLGLTSTWFDSPDRPRADDLPGAWSTGIVAGDPSAPYAAVSSGAWTAGALLSTVEDLATFLVALVAGDLLSAESFEAMTDTGTSGYGFGINSARLGNAGQGWAHSGSIPGFHATMSITSDGANVIAIATNSDQLVADELALRILVQL